MKFEHLLIGLIILSLVSVGTILSYLGLEYVGIHILYVMPIIAGLYITIKLIELTGRWVSGLLKL